MTCVKIHENIGFSPFSLLEKHPLNAKKVYFHIVPEIYTSYTFCTLTIAGRWIEVTIIPKLDSFKLNKRIETEF